MKRYSKIFLALITIEFGSVFCAGTMHDPNNSIPSYASLMANPDEDEEDPLPPEPIQHRPAPQDTLIVNGKLVILIYGQ